MSQYEVQACKYPQPAKEQMGSVFLLCRSGKWSSVLECVRSNPWIAMTPMVMDNHISTTILHQAITSKGDTAARAKVVLTVLDKTPMAAAIKNGYGSLPLHVISQRNTKMDAQTKERLIFQLVQAYKGALMEEGGVGKRTPLHIIFTGMHTQQGTNDRYGRETTLTNEFPHSLFPYRLHFPWSDGNDDQERSRCMLHEGQAGVLARSCCLQSPLLPAKNPNATLGASWLFARTNQ